MRVKLASSFDGSLEVAQRRIRVAYKRDIIISILIIHQFYFLHVVMGVFLILFLLPQSNFITYTIVVLDY